LRPNELDEMRSLGIWW